MGLSAIFGMLAGVYHWYPKMYGRMMNLKLGYIHFWGTFICAYGTFFPMHFLGMAGLPRRYYSNTAFPMFDNLLDINEVVSFFAIVGALIQVIFFFNFFYSMYRGPKAPQNPWKSNTLEWTTPVEHIHEIGQVKYQKFIDGLTIILSLVWMMILFHKLFP